MRVWIATVLILIPGVASAAPLVTDRPTVGESSLTVGTLTFQVEVGPDIQTDSFADTTITKYRTPIELRYGITEGTEVHLQSAGFASDQRSVAGSKDQDTGVADLELGFKSNFFRGQGVLGIPSTGLSITFIIPIGTTPFSSRSLIPKASLLFDWALPARAALGANIGITFNQQADPRTLGRADVPVTWAVGAGRMLAGPVGGFVELFGEVPTSGPRDPQASFDGGLIWLISDDIQLDVAGRFGITQNAPDWGGTMGISFRHDWGQRF